MRIAARQLAAGAVSTAVVAATLTAATAGTTQALGTSSTPAWTGFAADAQHTGQAPASPQPLDQHPLEGPGRPAPTQPAPEGPIAHYASPMITSANTVVVPTRIGKHKGFELRAFAGADGTPMWRLHTDYTVPLGAEGQWPPPIPASLVDDSHVAVAAAGGTAADPGAGGPYGRPRPSRLLLRAQALPRTPHPVPQAVQITTPLTTGPDGSLYFGFSATKDAPGRLRNGIARISPSGHGSWVSARKLAGRHQDAHVALNSAPALSDNGRTAYVALLSGRAPLAGGVRHRRSEAEVRARAA